MAGCTQAKRAECEAQGKMCNPKTGRCKNRTEPKRKSSGGGRGKKKQVSDSAIASAVMKQVGTDTQVSLATKRRSKKLGAGLDTMVMLTKDQMAAMGKCKPCTNPQRPVQDKTTCKCYAYGSAAARKQGICMPRQGTKNGMRYTYETVPVQRDGSIRCIKAGGRLAKETLGAAGCAPNKVLRSYSRCVSRSSDGIGVTKGWSQGKCPRGFAEVKYDRCVKAIRENKDCPMNQVLAEDPNFRGFGGRGVARRCMLPKTAAKKGLRVIAQGTLPLRKYRVARSTGL